MSYQHILVPVDGSVISFSAVKHAVNLAQVCNSQLTLISIIAEDPFKHVDFYPSSVMMKDYFLQAYANAEEALKEARDLAQEYNVETSTHIVKGQVSGEGVVEASEQFHADLIVMGSHGRKGLSKFFLGSFAQDVLKQTSIPVLIIKA